MHSGQLAPRVMIEGERTLPFTPVFIGGMPRTGTTLVSAMVSTSKECNSFLPEFHYVMFLMEALAKGIAEFNSSPFCFKSKDQMISTHMDFVRDVLLNAWEVLGRPSRLVLKHPSITPMFGLIAKEIVEAKFIVIIRDSRDTISSMISAIKKLKGPGYIHSEQDIEAFITGYNNYYKSIIMRSDTTLSQNLLALRYESVVSGKYSDIGDFLGVRDIDLSRLWGSETYNIADYTDNAFYSSHWGKTITDKTIGTFANVIDAELAERVSVGTERVSTEFLSLVAKRKHLTEVS